MQKVSVILTTFNGANAVGNTIDSILKQESRNHLFELELIVVDDCSTDKTVSLVEQFECKLLSTETNSGGPNKGRNMGLKVATGDYICIADQDDVWKPEKIKTLLPYLEQTPIVSSGYTLIDTFKNKTIQRYKASSKSHILYEKNETFLKKLTKNPSGQQAYLGSLIFSKKFKNIFFEEQFGMVDFDWILRLFHQQASIELCDSLYVRHVEKDNLSLNETYRQNDFTYSLLTLEHYKEQYPQETIISRKRIHGSMARYYYLMGNMKKARFYFLKSPWNLKTIMYYLTSYAGSKFVKRMFNVFG